MNQLYAARPSCPLCYEVTAADAPARSARDPGLPRRHRRRRAAPVRTPGQRHRLLRRRARPALVGGLLLGRRHRDQHADGDLGARRRLSRRVRLRRAGDRLPARPQPGRVRAAAAVHARRLRQRLPVFGAAIRRRTAGPRRRNLPRHPAAGRGRAAVRLGDPDQAAAGCDRVADRLRGDHRRAVAGHRTLYLCRRHPGGDLDRRHPDDALHRRRLRLHCCAAGRSRAGRPRPGLRRRQVPGDRICRRRC